MGFVGSTIVFLGVMVIFGAAMISNSMDETRKEWAAWRALIEKMKVRS